MNSEFISAIADLEKEKGISKELLIDAIEQALVSAYKKNYGTSDNVRVDIDRETGDINVYMKMEIVDEVENDMLQISIDEAREIDPRYEVGDSIEYQVTPRDFGRIAAQTAKQVVVQRIREAERGVIYDDYISRQNEIITGIIQRISNGTVFMSLGRTGRTEGILSVNEQVPGEEYYMNQRLKVYIMDVKKTTKGGPQVFLSRSHPGLVKRLFELEVPEIQEGVVEIMNIAREAGSRTKIAVYAHDEEVDPVGACVGTRGSRVQAVVDELNGEKIDIIPWSDDPAELISNVLSPAKVEEVYLSDTERAATVVVPDYQLSLAIGKEGQNVRLAAKLCGWKIDIKSHTQFYEGGYEDEYYDDEPAEEAAETVEEPAEKAAPETAEAPAEEAAEAPAENTAEAPAGEQDAE